MIENRAGVRLAALALLLGPSWMAAEEASRTDGATPAAVEVGSEAPDFELDSPDGTRHRLSALRGEKSVVLVFYRGVW